MSSLECVHVSPTRTHSRAHLHTTTTTANKIKKKTLHSEFKWSLADKRINSLAHLSNGKKNTDKRRRKLLLQPITQMKTKLVMPHERHQMRKETYYRIHLYYIGKGGRCRNEVNVNGIRAQEQK